MRATVLQLAIPTIEHRDAVRVRVFTLLVLMALTGVTKKRMEDSVRKVSEPAYNRIARHNVLTVLVTTMAIREGISLVRVAITSMPSKEAIVLVPTTIAMRVKVVISPVKVAMASVLSRAIVPVPTSMREKVATSLVSKVAMVSSVVAMVSSAVVMVSSVAVTVSSAVATVSSAVATVSSVVVMVSSVVATVSSAVAMIRMQSIV